MTTKNFESAVVELDQASDMSWGWTVTAYQTPVDTKGQGFSDFESYEAEADALKAGIIAAHTYTDGRIQVNPRNGSTWRDLTDEEKAFAAEESN